jgi:hypothetical protein
MISACVSFDRFKYEVGHSCVLGQIESQKHGLLRACVVIDGDEYVVNAVSDLAISMPNCTVCLVPRSVESLGKYTFASWRSLRDVAFEPGSRLAALGELSFA